MSAGDIAKGRGGRRRHDGPRHGGDLRPQWVRDLAVRCETGAVRQGEGHDRFRLHDPDRWRFHDRGGSRCRARRALPPTTDLARQSTAPTSCSRPCRSRRRSSSRSSRISRRMVRRRCDPGLQHLGHPDHRARPRSRAFPVASSACTGPTRRTSSRSSRSSGASRPSDETARATSRAGREDRHGAGDVDRDVAGFVENRILYAIMREALHLLDEGVASAEAIDTITSGASATSWP